MRINNVYVNDLFVEKLISKILDKKELRKVSREHVKNIVVKELSKDKKSLQAIINNNPRSKHYKAVISKTRGLLHYSCGMFQLSTKKKNELLQKKDWDALLKTHQSTKERYSSYNGLYNKIFSITGLPDSVLDLGCGLNPLSFNYAGLPKNTKYVASDINHDDLRVVNYFFKSEKINGFTMVLDLEKQGVFDNLGFFDACLILKTLHVVESGRNHRVSERIIRTVPARWVVVSFATRKLSGKSMRFSGRKWFELMLERHKYKYVKFFSSNEVFYVFCKD